MENKATINKIIPFSNVDGPGNRLAIFFQRCNINCVYCHNPETINKCINCLECIPGCPTNAIRNVDGIVIYNEKKCVECDQCIKACKYNSSPRTKDYDLEELMTIIKSYKPFIRGITVSGGEPTLYADYIAELFKGVKPLGLTCFVDSNGFFNRDEISKLIKEADKFMIDIKAVNNLEKLCGNTSNNNIDNLIYLLKEDKVYEVRTVIVHDYLDIENTIDVVANIVKNYPEVIYKLIRVHSSGLKPSQKESIRDKIPTEEYMKELGQRIKSIGVKNVELIL